MQPRRLTMINFGPFIHETVDFGAFAGSGLFLISGKTGAGKTTIFDGMTYALFGQTSGKLRAPKEMRSAFAPPTEETAVTFSFEHGGYLYQVERRPEQEVAKKRGSGMTKRAAKTTLTIFDEVGQEQRQITKDVDGYITELLHLTADQFFKIIMLPQGEFRNFLVASSRDKEQVLQRMFDTQLYGRLNEWLKTQVADGAEMLKRLEIKAQTVSEHFQWNDLTKKRDYPTLPELLTAWQNELAQLKEAEQKQNAAVKQAKQLEKQAENAFYQGKELQSRFDEVAQMEKKALALAEQADRMATVAEKVSRLTWAKEHRHLPEELKKEKEQVQQLRQRLATVQLEQTTVNEKLSTWQAEVETMTDIKTRLTAQQQELAAKQLLVPLAQKAATQEQTVAATQAELVISQKQLVDLTVQKQGWEQELATIENVLDQEASWQEQKLQLQQLTTLLANWQKAAEKLAESTKRFADNQQQNAQTTEKLAINKEAVTHCYEELLDLKSRQASVMIAKLALDLRPGTPCPVCGSLDHPGSHQGEVAFSETEIQENEARLQALEETWQQGQQQTTALTTTLNQLSQRHKELQEEVTQNQETSGVAHKAMQDLLGLVWQKGLSLSGLAAESAQPEEQLQLLTQQVQGAEIDLTKARAKQQQLQAKLATLAEKIQQAVETTRQTENRLQQQTGQLEELQGQLGKMHLSELEVVISELLADNKQLTSTLADYDKQGQQLKETRLMLTTRYQEITSQIETAKTRVKQAKTALTQLLATAPFAKELDEAGLQQLIQDLPQLPPLTETLQQYRQQQDYVTRSRGKLQEQLKEAESPDLPALEASFTQATSVFEEEQKQLNFLSNQQKNNQSCAKELEKLIAENQQQLSQQGELLQLADTIGGRNAYKTSLERYILQSYLQEILVVANQRLMGLTRGRYQFQLADKDSGGRGMKGLDIDIYDDNAGLTRRVQTLSGGESFIAALALALSLADVIQNRSGGIAIEALFIDEGFGSLDEESLEMAMEALSLIETEGRLIGIISHVAELKTSIPRQVLVHADGAGQSKIEMQVAFHQ